MATARLAQSVEHETLNLRVVGSSPTLGADLLSCGRPDDLQEEFLRLDDHEKRCVSKVFGAVR